MLRTVLGVVVGYVAMAVAVVVLLSVAYLVMGADRVYAPGVYEVSTLWILAFVPLNLLAGLIGGVVCRAIARRSGAVIALCVVVLVLGVGSALATKARYEKLTPDDRIRTGQLKVAEAAAKSVSPMWVHYATPVLGIAGVLAGSALVGRRRGAPSAA